MVYEGGRPRGIAHPVENPFLFINMIAPFFIDLVMSRESESIYKYRLVSSIALYHLFTRYHRPISNAAA